MIHSDDPGGIQRLNQEAAKAHARRPRGGAADLATNEALRWMTANPAWALGLQDRIGTLEQGKEADVVVWDGYPFSVYTRAEKVYIDGALMFDRDDPSAQPVSDFEVGILPGEVPIMRKTHLRGRRGGRALSAPPWPRRPSPSRAARSTPMTGAPIENAHRADPRRQDRGGGRQRDRARRRAGDRRARQGGDAGLLRRRHPHGPHRGRGGGGHQRLLAQWRAARGRSRTTSPPPSTCATGSTPTRW